MKHNFEIIPLTIEAKGEIILNNLPEFRELVREALGNINRDLRTDEEFGQAEIDVKALKTAEDAVREAAIKAFDDQLKTLIDELNATAEEIRIPRLELEKLIAARKEQVKTELVEEFLGTFDIDPALARKQYQASLKAQMSGKRTLDSMRKALRIYAATQQGMIAKCRAILDSFETAHGTEMTMDRRTLELEKPEGLEAELRRRFEAKKAADERRRLEDEAAKARADAAKSAAAAAEAIRQAEAAKQPAKPAPLPTPPKIGSIPTGSKAAPSGESNVVPFAGNTEIGPDMEWESFRSAVFTSFGPLKAAKDALKHPDNIVRAASFSQGVNAAWQAANAKEVAS